MSESIWLSFRKKAAEKPKRIILADGDDARVKAAAEIIRQQKIADPILISKDFLNQLTETQKKRFRQILSVTAKLKSAPEAEREAKLTDPLWVGALLLKENVADGFVGGAARTTSDTLKAIFNIIGLKEGVSTLFGFFLIEPREASSERPVVLLADCAVLPDPSPKQLSNIALGSAQAFQFFTQLPPRIAFLSFSTAGSAQHEKVEAVRQGLVLAQSKNSGYEMVGEWQADSALDITSATVKGVGNSPMAGKANVLVVPDLNTGNIAYKLVQRLGNCRAVGPVIWGMKQPANDLSRGCSIEDIVDMVSLTTIQAQVVEG